MGDDGPQAELDAAVGAIALVDHHVHPALATELSHGELELITESDRPIPPGTTRFDSQLGVDARPGRDGGDGGLIGAQNARRVYRLPRRRARGIAGERPCE